MARVKGSALRSSIAFLTERLGEQGFEKVVASLPEGERALFEAPVLQSNWYEFSLLLHLMDGAAPLLPHGGKRSLAWDLGRFSAEHGLTTLYKVFFRVADPGFIIRKASQVFSNYYDSGRMELVSLQGKESVLRVTGFDQPCTLFCDRVQGWMERTLEMTGAKAIVMTHPKCMARGDSCCEFHGRWN
jgi:hypothetical protein